MSSESAGDGIDSFVWNLSRAHPVLFTPLQIHLVLKHLQCFKLSHRRLVGFHKLPKKNYKKRCNSVLKSIRALAADHEKCLWKSTGNPPQQKENRSRAIKERKMSFMIFVVVGNLLLRRYYWRKFRTRTLYSS